MVKFINIIFILFLFIGCQKKNSYIEQNSINITIKNNSNNDIYNLKVLFYKGNFSVYKIEKKQSFSKAIKPTGDSGLAIKYKINNKLVNKKLGIYFSKGMRGNILIKINSLNEIDIENNLTIN